METMTPREITVAVPGGELTVEHHGGDGPAAVLLHYWGGSARTWAPVVDLLAGRRVVAWDQRGWGRQSGLPGPYGPEALAHDVERVVDVLDLHDVVLVGHSQGGKVAQLVGRARPAWLRGLALIAPAPPRAAVGVTAEYREALSHAYDTRETVADAVDHVLTSAPLPPDLRCQVLDDSTSACREAARVWPRHGIALELPAGTIEVPTVVLVGEHDRVEPADVIDELVMPGLRGPSRRVVVRRAGHLLPLEAPSAVAEAVRELLVRTAPPCGDRPAGEPRVERLATDDATRR